MTRPDIPFSSLYDLGALTERGAELVLVPSAEQREAISGWLGTQALESLNATVRLSRNGEDHYSYEGQFDADVVQACVVTLEPVRSHLTGSFRRDFRLLPRVGPSRRQKPSEPTGGIDVSALDEEECETIESSVIDLAGPLLEEISLALDPYPRAPDAAFAPAPEEARPADSPFAVLEKLKAAPSGPGKAEGPGKPARSGKRQG